MKLSGSEIAELAEQWEACSDMGFIHIMALLEELYFSQNPDEEETFLWRDRLREKRAENAKVEPWTEGFVGPFAIVVTDPANPNDDMYPYMVRFREGQGYSTREELVFWIEQNFGRRKEPYLGLHFEVVQDGFA